MSTIKVSGSATGTGDITIAAPVTNSSRTQTLPDATGTVVLDSATQTLTNKTIQQTVSVISGNTNAAAGTFYVLTASLTLTLPATPTAGDTVMVQNSSGTVTAVIGRNGSNIMSLAEDMTLNTTNVAVTLVYADATRGWVFG